MNANIEIGIEIEVRIQINWIKTTTYELLYIFIYFVM